MLKYRIAIVFLLIIQYGCNSQTKQDSIVTHRELNHENIEQIPNEIVDSIKALEITKEIVLGKINYVNDSSFIKVSNKYSNKAIYLKKEVYQAFLRMSDSAKKQNIHFTIISGTRNFSHQKSIWERKWKRDAHLAPVDRIKNIMKFSSMPTTSRHHWGTDFDLNNLNNDYFASGNGKKEYEWLVENAGKFGFGQVYSEKSINNRTGYELEKWHWSYMPLAKQYLDFYNENIIYEDIQGFSGSELAEELNIIKNYVNGISLLCLRYKSQNPISTFIKPVSIKLIDTLEIDSSCRCIKD